MALYAKSLFAENYVVTSSVVSMSIAHASGSTIFGDTADDSHTFTGNITASGNVSGSSTSTASFGYYQGITSFAGADGTELLFSGSAASTASFGMVENGSGRFYTSGSSLVFESPNLTDFKILQTGLGTNSAGPTITLGNNGQGNLNEGTLKFEIGRLVSNRGITANGASVNATEFNTVNARGTAGTAVNVKKAIVKAA